jgi:tripartite-type tricarboxylate transporter receptor subunit TctC
MLIRPLIRLLLAAALLALGLSATLSPAWSQEGKFPSRTIRIVVPFPPGGGVDTLARLLAERMRTQMKANVIVENRAGASGTIGGAYVMQSPPDGYTVLFSSNTHTMTKLVMANPPYDPLNDFTPIALLGEAPLLAVIAGNQPQRTLAEIADAARKDPKGWTAGTPALGSPGHLATLSFNHLTDAKITIAAYRGTAPALNDVAGGHIQMLIDAMVVLLPMAKSGRVKPIAVTSKQRSVAAPGIPTAAESGIPGLDVVAWYGMWGPKGMPADVVATLYAAAARALLDLAASGRLAELGVEPTTGSALGRFQADQVQHAADLLKHANFKPQ